MEVIKENLSHAAKIVKNHLHLQSSEVPQVLLKDESFIEGIVKSDEDTMSHKKLFEESR